MGWRNAQKTLARTVAMFGLAAVIATGTGGAANAAPADRAGDEVVLKGSELGALAGVQPAKIVAFKWSGKWVQVPVQVDERHTVDVRRLYPAGNFPPYVGNDDPDFDLEIYSDEKTLAGADPDAGFDANDELVFMGGDAGSNAPADADRPSGVNGASRIKVKVNDPVGGGSGAVYLFRATGNLDPSAGRDYVDYDFKLTELGEGQTLKDDYKYFTSGGNPEDSTVRTDAYELHSFDRWQEDEMKITAGDANGTDILDREVAQATKIACVRSEYTFSGRWTEDLWNGNDTATDDEGTYVTVIDGPVRAIRTYMGANSGPYVQREHIYYADHERNTIYLRVHVMTDLYSWTDYSPAAIGMTYRDVKNPDGVTVDGEPDNLVPTTTSDVANGAYAWQQISGPQGTATTVVGSETDIPNPNFGNYYLDDATPTALDETQCGGDGQSIGASGFGILGPVTPNTDPRLGTFNNLTVDRVRYFGPPSDGVDQARDYTARVQEPLAASSTAAPITGAPKLKLSFPGKKAKARKGRAYRLRVKVRNPGRITAGKVRICVRGNKLRKTGRCLVVAPVRAGKGRTVVVKVRVNGSARGRKLPLVVTAKSLSAKATAKSRLRVGLRR